MFIQLNEICASQNFSPRHFIATLRRYLSLQPGLAHILAAYSSEKVVSLKLHLSPQEIGPASRDVFLDSADALIASDGARESLASALSALSGIRTSQRSLLSGAEETTTVMITNRIGFRSKGEAVFFSRGLLLRLLVRCVLAVSGFVRPRSSFTMCA